MHIFSFSVATRNKKEWKLQMYTRWNSCFNSGKSKKLSTNQYSKWYPELARCWAQWNHMNPQKQRLFLGWSQRNGIEKRPERFEAPQRGSTCCGWLWQWMEPPARKCTWLSEEKSAWYLVWQPAGKQKFSPTGSWTWVLPTTWMSPWDLP